jgi:hypothetical protein
MSEIEIMPWVEGDWLPLVQHWIDRHLQARGASRTGPLDPFHVRPWSTVIRVPTATGRVYFKATAPSLGHEAALTAALARWAPDLVVPVLAVDPTRSWLLLADAGEVLRSYISTPADLARWHEILRRYAALQQALAPRVGELLALGVPDRRLALLPTLLARLLDEEEALLVGQPQGLTAQEQRQLLALVPRVAAAGERLGALGIAETLYNEDFHDNNVFVRDGRALLCDWGDGSISHPFLSMLVNLRSPAYRLQLPADHPALLRLRDVYLDAWSDSLDEAARPVAFRLACWLGMLNRALTWHRVLAPVPPALSAPYADNVPGWLQEFLQEAPADLV